MIANKDDNDMRETRRIVARRVGVTQRRGNNRRRGKERTSVKGSEDIEIFFP